MALCKTCNREVDGQAVSCPTCGRNLEAWKQEAKWAAQIDYPPRIQVFLVLVSVIVVALVLLQPIDLKRVVVAFILSAIVALAIYALRYRIWEGRWLRQVQSGAGLSLLHFEIGMAVLTVALAVATATIGRAWAEDPLLLEQKLVLYLLLSATCVALATSLELASVLSYVSGLDNRVPPPVFMDMNRLSELVLAAAGKHLGVEQWEVLAIQRMPHGGLKITIKPKASVTPAPAGGTASAPSGPRLSWSVEADRWGRIHWILPTSSTLL